MANTLMFEIGVQEAKGQLTALETRLKKIVDDYGSMQIKVDVQNLQKFITALESIGNGKQLEPLLERIDLMQRRLAAMGNSGSFLNFLKSEAEQAARVMEGYEKKFAEIRNAFSIYPEKDAPKREAQINRIKESEEYQRALERHTNASRELAQEQERLANAQKNEGNAASELNSKIQQLSQSIESLSGKTFSVNMGNEFKTWAQEVQNLTTQVKELVAQFEKLNKTGKVNTQSNLFTEEVAAMEKKVAELRTQYEQLQQAVQQTTTAITQQTTAQQGVANASAKASQENNNAEQKKLVEMQRQQKMLTEVQAMYEKIASLSSAGTGLNPKRINDVAEGFKRLMADLSTIPPAKNLQVLAAEFAALKTSSKNFFDELKQGSKAVENLRTVRLALKLINDQIASGNSSAKLEGLRDRLQAINREMHNLMKEGKFDAVQQLWSGHKGMSDGAINVIRQSVTERNKLTQATSMAASATSQYTMEEQKLAQALSRSTSEMQSQSQILGDLKMMAYQYLSVWGAQQFLSNIIEIGGQLEMQRLSIGSILQNQAQANDLFGQIKGLALKSPFGVVELDQMTKQLTAYGYKYNELFDMTKRLADISAATGTSVDRLALALGHVKSEAALSGYTLRQFSMGNVPLLVKLSEKLGKTTEEIRKMVRAKEITYEDVVGVLKDLTNDGGMFYNMQEVISQSVKAKFKNVRDAMDIMYGEMAEGAPGEALKGIADALMELAKNWRDVLTVVGTATAVWAAHRASILAMNVALGSNTAALHTNILAYKQKRAQELMSEAMVRKLTADEMALISTRKMITAANLQVALSSGAVTKGEALKLVALRKVNIEEAKSLIRMGEFTAAEIRMALQGKILGVSLGKAGAAIKLFGMQVKSAMAAFLMNPWTWAMAGITAIVELWQRQSAEMDKAAELGDKIFERMTEGIKNVRNLMKETNMTFTVDGKSNVENYGVKPGTITFPDASSLSSDEMKSLMESWSTFIKDYSATPNLMLNAAYATDENGKAVHNLAEQYKILGENAIVVMNSLPYLQDLSTAFKDAIEDADAGAFDDSLTTDLKQYEEAYRKHQKLISATVSAYRKETFAALNAAKANKEYSEAIEKAGISSENIVGQIMLLADRKDDLKEAVKLFEEGWGKVGDKRDAIAFFQTGEMKGQFEELKSEYEEFAKQVEITLSGQGWDFKNLKPEQIQALSMGISDLMTEAGLSVDQVKEKLQLLCQARWGIIIDDNIAEEKAKVSAMKAELDKLVSNGDKDRKFSIEIGTSTNFFEVVDAINKGYKKAKEIIEKAPPILVRLGLKLDITKAGELTDEQINQLAGNDPVKRAVLEALRMAQRQVNDAMAASKAYGFNLEEPKHKRASGRKKSGSQEDKDAKTLRERIRILKEAADAYKYWKDEVEAEKAEAHVNERYGSILKEIGFNFENIKQFRETLLNEIKKYESIYEKSGKKRPKLLEAIKEAYKIDENLERDAFKESSKEYASQVKIEIDSLTRAWEIFNKVREETGDETLASMLGGGTFDAEGTLEDFLREDIEGTSDTSLRNLADALKDKLQKAFNEMEGGIPFDMNLSDEDIEKNIRKALPRENEEKIQGIIDLYKKWRDLQRDVFKNDIDVFAKLVGSAKDYASQLRVINTQEDSQIEALDAIVKDNPELQGDVDRAKAMVNADAEEKRWKLTSVYAQLMNNSLALTREEIEYGINKQVDILNQKMQAGLITAQEYADEMAKVDNIRSEWNKNSFFGKSSAFAAGLLGGVSGRATYYKGQINKAREGGETDKEGKYKKKLDRLEGFDNLMNQFKALANALDPVINLFDQLGMKDVGQAIGIGQNALNNAASMGANAAALLGESAGPYGAAIGAGLSIVSGIFAMHDAALQEEIDALKANNAALDANTEVIKAIRERTLGYDTGDIRRRLASDYILPDPSKDFSALLKTVTDASYMAMREFYGYNSEGSGYSQELENLRKERENYMNMYRAEKGKKDSSEEDLEEYKKKIAELDEQILYFTQDLYKELWNIDIKGWSDQIGDALWAAFENGEDAVKAFGDTAKEIVSGVAKDMWELSILQPMFEDLQKALFGTYENGRFTGGTIRYDSNGNIDMQASEQPTLEVLGKFFGENGFYQNAIDSGEQFFDWVERVTGMDLSNNDTSSSKIIQGGFNENETGLLLSYVNAIRADVSVDRQMFAQYLPMYYQAMTAGNDQLAGIRQHVSEIERTNSIISDKVGEIRDDFHGLRTGTWRVPMA